MKTTVRPTENNLRAILEARERILQSEFSDQTTGQLEVNITPRDQPDSETINQPEFSTLSPQDQSEANTVAATFSGSTESSNQILSKALINNTQFFL